MERRGVDSCILSRGHIEDEKIGGRVGDVYGAFDCRLARCSGTDTHSAIVSVSKLLSSSNINTYRDPTAA